jgi:hypothetical protein
MVMAYVIGWCLIAVGVAGAGRQLLWLRRAGKSPASPAGQWFRFTLFGIGAGVFLVTIPLNDTARWIIVAVVASVTIWDRLLWLWARRTSA